MIERVPTGIIGLDEHIEGGFPKGRTILVSGGCGTGKSIFSFQFLYKGAVEHDEPGVALILDERPEKLRQDMLRFGWDLEKLENKGKIAIIDASTGRIGVSSEERYAISPMNLNLDHLLLETMKVADQIGAQRIIIDSLSSIGFHAQSLFEVRKSIMKINYMVEKSGMTAILTSEIPEQAYASPRFVFSRYGVEEYVADGVIVLHYLDVGTQSNRTLFIRKMRGTKHTEGLLPMEITEKGIVVHRLEEKFQI